MGVKVTASTRRRHARTTRARRRATLEALTAAGVAPAPMLTSYEITMGSPAGRWFNEQALAAGHAEYGYDRWPCEVEMLDASAASFRDGGHAVWRLADGTLVMAALDFGWFHVHVASSDPAQIGRSIANFRKAYPASYLRAEDDTQVPITFWALGPHGPISRLRKIEAASWDDVAGNYASAVREELDALMEWSNGPGRDGQLMLWQGPPGTGKTWALRALASEWSSWAEFHYITDPDAFFVDSSAYMVDVLLADSYDVIEEDTGAVFQEQGVEGKWRVLILEDTGELLSAHAKEKYGQGLSRLLNVVDGMIGQGLRVLCLVTTNDELGDLNPAVRRPGRCASQLVFGPFEPSEASLWLGEEVDEPMTVAEMYARRGDAEPPLEVEARPDYPDDPEPEDAYELMASADRALTAGAVVAETEKGREIGEAAARHAPEGGYGETAWNEDDGLVWWNAADWTTDEEEQAAVDAFMAIDDVESVEVCYECSLPDGNEWEIVYRSGATRPPEENALRDALALARSPLPEIEEPPVTASADVGRALDTIAAVHQRTVEGITAVTAASEKQ